MMNQKYGKLLNTTEDIRWVQTEPFRFDFIKESDGITEITPNGSFLEGITLNREQIYILMTRPIKMQKGVVHFNTDIVVVGDSVANEKLMGIECKGGVLDLLFMPDRMKIDLSGNGEYEVEIKEDSVFQTVIIDGKKYTVEIFSSLHEKHGVRGHALINDQVTISVTVDGGIDMEDVIPIYNAIHKVCQFLTFRQNVRFDEVGLLFEERYEDMVFGSSRAKLFSRDDFSATTEKKWIHCIPFVKMKEAFGNLFKTIYEEIENKPFFSLDFLPKEDKDEGWITPERIRSICTALESEAMLQKLVAPENPEFESLIQSVKKVVSEHRKSNHALPQKTYDVISGSISHWDFAAADKMKALFHKYEDIVIQGRYFTDSVSKFEEGIDRIIKYRNRITHGSFMSTSQEDANVAVNLINLIYISRLDRLGMPRETIRELIRRGVVY